MSKSFKPCHHFLQGVHFAKILAEDHPKLSVEHKISAVPTFLLFLSGKQVDRLDGANAAKLSQMVKTNVLLYYTNVYLGVKH